MHLKRTVCAYVLLTAAALSLASSVPVRAGSEPQWGPGVQQTTEPDFYLTFTPALPSVNEEVVASVVAKNGMPSNAVITWNVAGAPFRDAGIKDPQTGSYAFTPASPGSFTITAEVNIPGVLTSISTLELVIAPGMPAQPANTGMGTGGLPAEISLDLNPSLPRVGREATFTLRYSAGIPENAEVRWDVSGGVFNDARIQGRNKEICSFIPTEITSYLVKADLYNSGQLMGEITLQFFPMQ